MFIILSNNYDEFINIYNKTLNCIVNNIHSNTLLSSIKKVKNNIIVKDKSKLVCLMGKGFIKTVYKDIFPYPP